MTDTLWLGFCWISPNIFERDGSWWAIAPLVETIDLGDRVISAKRVGSYEVGPFPTSTDAAFHVWTGRQRPEGAMPEDCRITTDNAADILGVLEEFQNRLRQQGRRYDYFVRTWPSVCGVDFANPT